MSQNIPPSGADRIELLYQAALGQLTNAESQELLEITQNYFCRLFERRRQELGLRNLTKTEVSRTCSRLLRNIIAYVKALTDLDMGTKSQRDTKQRDFSWDHYLHRRYVRAIGRYISLATTTAVVEAALWLLTEQ